MSEPVARFADACNGYQAWGHCTIVANQWYETAWKRAQVFPDTNSDFLVTPAHALPIIKELCFAPDSRGSSGELAAPAYGLRTEIRNWTKST